MLTLPGSEYLDAGSAGDGGDGGAGADGSGADGAAIANTTLKFTDADGKIITVKTDANGYYRINLGGMKAPMVASVQRSTNAWKSVMVDVIQSGRKNFYTINLTGLSDLVMSRMAQDMGLAGADAITPALLSSNMPRLEAALQSVNTQIATQLQSAGLNPATFNPCTLAFRPNGQGYDKVLDSVTINRDSNGGTTIDTSGGSGGNNGLPGMWSLELTTIESGTSYTAPPVSIAGSSVPASQSIADTHPLYSLDGTGLADGVYDIGNGYTLTKTGNTIREQGPGTDFTYVFNQYHVNSYTGCGSCGVGSVVTIDLNVSVTMGGTSEGQTIPTETIAYHQSYRYTRTQ